MVGRSRVARGMVGRSRAARGRAGQNRPGWSGAAQVSAGQNRPILSRAARQNRLGLLLLAPSLTGVLLFYKIPFIDVARRSFCDAMGRRFAGLANFRQLADDQAFRLALTNTVRYELVCLPLLLALSLLLALLVWKLGGAHGFCGTAVLPLALPSASMVLVWQIFLCRQGILDQLLGSVTAQPWERDWVHGPWAFGVLVAAYLWKNTGYDMLLWLSGLRAVPEQLYEAARIDGAGTLDRFRYITVPCLKGTARLVLMLSLINSFQVFREAFLLAGSYPDESIYLFWHLFGHWSAAMDVQKMCTAAFLLAAAGAAVQWCCLWGGEKVRGRIEM